MRLTALLILFTFWLAMLPAPALAVLPSLPGGPEEDSSDKTPDTNKKDNSPPFFSKPPGVKKAPGKKKKVKKKKGFGNELLNRDQLYKKIKQGERRLDLAGPVLLTTTGVAAAGLITTNYLSLPTGTSNLINYSTLGVAGGTLAFYYIYAYGMLNQKGAILEQIDLNYEMAARYNGNPFLQKSHWKETQARWYSGVYRLNNFRQQLLGFTLVDLGLFLMIPKNPKGTELKGKGALSFTNGQTGRWVGFGAMGLGAALILESLFDERMQLRTRQYLRDDSGQTDTAARKTSFYLNWGERSTSYQPGGSEVAGLNAGKESTEPFGEITARYRF